MSAHVRPVVGVLGSGQEPHVHLSVPLGAWLARAGYHLLTGAGRGVMAAVAEAFCAEPAHEGLSLGIVPGSVDTNGWHPKAGYPNPHVELAVNTHLPLSGEQGTDPMSRNHLNVLSAHVLVSLPGGAGTRSEAELAVRYGKPLVLFGPREAFADFPPGLERTDSLERACAFVLRHAPAPR